MQWPFGRILNNDGPWGSPPPSSGQNDGPRRNGPSRPPDFNDFFRQNQDRFKKILPGDRGNGPGAALILGGLAALWLLSGFYRVESDETGIELTFGKWVNQANPSQPGLHYHWPYPIGSVETPVITRENRITIGFQAAGGDLGNRATWRDAPQESLMLTGDENIIDIDFAVFWQVKDGGNFLFNVRNPEEALRTTAESVMREVIGQRPIDAALVESRQEIEATTRERIQKIMDSYGTGISVMGVQLLEANPPREVVPAFNDVQSAEQDKDRLRNDAEAYRNAIIPQARGQAVKMTQEAEAYREQIVAQAKGETERFLSVYNSYKMAKDVTAQRMYLETMEQVMGKAQKIIIDEKGQNSGVVPYLRLPELRAATPRTQEGAQ